jgi:large subunit ribosomal protein L10
MSKTIKNLIERELEGKLKNIEGCAVLGSNGLDGNKNNKLRRKLSEQGMKMLVVKNSLARRATSESKLKGFEALLTGPSAIIFSEKAEVSSIARLLVDAKKDDETLTLRGVFFDGEAFVGDAGTKKVSSFPTRTEAIGQVVGALLGPITEIAGQLNQGGNIAALISAIEAEGKNG